MRVAARRHVRSGAEVAHVNIPEAGGNLRTTGNQIGSAGKESDEAAVTAERNLPAGFAIGRAAIDGDVHGARRRSASDGSAGTGITHVDISCRARADYIF